MISSLSTVLQYQNRPDWARQHGHPFAASPHSFASLVKPMDSILGSHRSVYSYVVKSISAGAVIPLSVHSLKVPAVEYIKRICSVYMNRCDSSPLPSEAGAKQVSGSLKSSAKLKIAKWKRWPTSVCSKDLQDYLTIRNSGRGFLHSFNAPTNLFPSYKKSDATMCHMEFKHIQTCSVSFMITLIVFKSQSFGSFFGLSLLLPDAKNS